MERRRSKRSIAAFLCAGIWAIAALCCSMPVCLVQKAHADGFPDDFIYIMAIDGATVDSDTVSTSDISVWGYFYRGMGLMEENVISFDTGSDTGEVTIEIIEDPLENDYEITFATNGDYITEVKYRDNTACPYRKFTQHGLLEFDDEHDFTYNAGKAEWEPISEDDGGGHWAECYGCDFKLQVAHRPGGENGTCIDCGASLGDDFVPSYEFEINDPTEWYEGDEGEYRETATIDIYCNGMIYVGKSLTLCLSCTGELANTESSVSYNLIVYADFGESLIEMETEGPLSEEPLWTFVPEDYDADEYYRAYFDGTITIEFHLIGLPAYGGEYTDSLTFSVNYEVV